METPWVLRDSDLMGRLRPQDVEVLQQVCPYRTFRRGDVLFRRGDEATYLHIIVKGDVRLLVQGADYHEHVLAVVGESDFVGEAFLTPHAKYRADAVVASEEAVVCPVSRNDYLQLAFRAPQFVLSFTEVLAGHLALCHDRLSVSAYPLQARVVHALLDEARRVGTPVEGGWVRLQIVLTHEELAARVHASRVSVTQVMADLRRQRFLDGTRGHYAVNVAELQRLLPGTRE